MERRKKVDQSTATANLASVRATKIRWFGGWLVFLLCFVAYLDRIAFSVNASRIMEAISITPIQFGVVTTVFSVGYFIFQIPGAMAVERFGSRVVLAVSLVLWSIFTALTGAMSTLVMLAGVRFLFGIGEAPIFPGGNHFFANWFTRQERGRSNSLMNGGAFSASIIGPPIIVAIVSALGWRISFVFCGILGIIAAAIWYFCTRSQPAEHPWVNEQELALITENNIIAAQKAKAKAPWALFLRQRSFWAIALGYFGTLWTVQFFLYWLPYYLQASRHLSFRTMGFYTSVPWIFIVAGVFSAGALSDLLLKKGFSRYTSRNLVCATGLAISAIALVLSTTAATAVGNILWLSLALGMAGFPQTLSWSISTDIGQQFTSTVGSWMNMWGFIAASIVPTVAPIVAKSYGWNQVLIVNAGVIVLGIIGYLLIKTDQPLRMSE
jgi:ACS family glucarate transporter-like MFS transporter